MKKLVTTWSLVFGMFLLCTCSRQIAQDPPREAERTKLINEFIALCEKRSQDYSKEKYVYAKYYRNGAIPEIIFEVKFTEGQGIAWPQKDQETIRAKFINQIGTEFTVGKIRDFGKHGIIFTFRGISHDNKVLYNIPIRFDEILEHFGHPNI